MKIVRLRKFRKYLSFVLSLSILVAPLSAYPISIELKTGIKLRSFQDGEMERVGMLKRGSIIEIPDQYAIHNKNGSVNFELTLNNWLRTESSLTKVQRKDSGAGLYKFDGQSHDYFFPVKIKKIAPGSTFVGDENQELYMGLKYMARKGRGLVVSEDSPAFTAEQLKKEFENIAGQDGYKKPVSKDRVAKKVIQPRPQVQAPAPAANAPAAKVSEARPSRSFVSPQEIARELNPEVRKPTETAAADASYCESCRAQGVVERLTADISQSLARVERAKKVNLQRVEHGEDKIARDFANSCGFSWSSFKQEMSRQVGHDPQQIDLLTRLMMQESSARCQIRNSEADRSASIGLFQINSGSTKYRRCNASEKRALLSASIDQMKSSYQCIENPIVNLKEAIRILKDKENSLARSGFDFNQMTKKDRQRMVLSAYNGGQKWVKVAKDDLQEFNRKNGTRLNHNNWEDLRLFYLRRALNSNEQRKYFGSVITRRKVNYSVINLAYVEAVVPRESSRVVASN